MRTGDGKARSETGRGLWGCVAAACLVAGPALARDIASCTSIAADAERLRCYDEAAGRRAPPAAPAPAPVAAPAATAAPRSDSILGRQWDLDPDRKGGTFAFRIHRPNYLLPFTHTDSVNTAVYQSTLDALQNAGLLRSNAKAPVDANEAAFQVSFKVKAVENLLTDRADLWLGYTQRSFWQVYNDIVSSPFRETNYEPEGMLVLRTDVNLLGLDWRFVNLGIVHQSNGRAQPTSRSWNRAYAQFGLERGNFAMTIRPWYRFKEAANDDDNPDIERYLGHGDVTMSYRFGRQEISALARYNASTGYGAGQLDWSFPIHGPLRGYVQVFSGYGYNLLDYNHKQTVGGIGVTLTDGR